MSFFQMAGTLAVALTAIGAWSSEGRASDARARQFVEYYETTVRPAEIEAARLYWTANLTGKEADFQKKQAAEERLDLLLADPQRFAELKAVRQAGVADPQLARQIEVLYLGCLEKQVDPELLKKMSLRSNAAERTFNVFRPTLDGKPRTDNDLRTILRNSTDSVQRKAAWMAGKQVGRALFGDLIELVRLRNQAARKLGFDNFFALRLHCNEQDPKQLLKMFDELDRLTREPFLKAKGEIDAALSRRYGVSVAELRPWHYHDPFFQEAPAVLGSLPESIYTPLDPVATCRTFYAGIGLPVDDILRRSSFYEQPGKNPHAFCIDIDRRGDVRVLENIVPGWEWTATTLHELGHGVYSLNVSPQLPYALRTDAHPLCTEGIAMMFERFARNEAWLTAMGAKIPDPKPFREAAARLQRDRLLVFSRFCQLMFRFEMTLYESADRMTDPERELSRLWWDLSEKYQNVRAPDDREQPDFAAKYHLVGAPIYYHNYLLGEMFASQVHHALVREVLPGVSPNGASYVGNPKAGEFLKRKVFEPGRTLRWDELTRQATGQPLSPKALAEDLRP
ncbi:MAG: M2 family metallopeptidase [Planctomycetaceae bacterium]|nr:M2 family metallopeptidase [Planctomycetaceae bacterium]